MQHPDEGTIHAWLDGELPPEEAVALEAHAAECTACAAAVAEARGYIAASSRIVSALDAVPGNVIPAMRAKRPWYASTQLRAAAAVIIVAGASLLVVRQTDKTSLDNVMVTSRSSAPAREVVPPPAATQSNRAASVVVTPKPETLSKSAKGSPRAQKAAIAKAPSPLAVTTASPVVLSAPAEAVENRASDEARSEASTGTAAAGAKMAFGRLKAADSATARRVSSTLNDVVVTGVAEAVDELTVVHVDTLSAAIRTTYRIPTGEEVTLTELTATAFSGGIAAPTRAPAPVAMQEQTNQAAVPNSITWVEKLTGRTATLSGPLSKEALEALRQKLPMERR